MLFSLLEFIYKWDHTSVQLLSHIWLFVTLWTVARQASLSITNSWSLSKLMSIELVMPSNHLIHCHPLLLLPSIFPSIRVFSNESVFLQHHSSKASILQCSAFFIVQLSHLHMTTGKTIALTRWTFVGKVMSLPFNKLSRLALTFLPRSKHLLISWLQSPSAVSLEPKKIKSVTVSTVSPSIYHEVMGQDAMILVFWILSFKSTFSLSSFAFIKRFFSSSSLSSIKVVPSACLRLLIFLPAILIPACASSSPEFLKCTLHVS